MLGNTPFRSIFRDTAEQAVVYPFRLSSLAYSALVHGGIVFLLGLASNWTSPLGPDEAAFRPESHKIQYYDLRKKTVVVAPRRQIGPIPRPRGKQASRQFVIAVAPKPKSTKQSILLPAPKIQPKEVAALPTLISRLTSSLPPLPEPPKEKPAPRVEAPKAPQPNPAPPEPQGDVARAPESNNDAIKVPKRQAKAFVPPPPSPTKPRLAAPTPVLDGATPSVGGPTMDVKLSAGAGMPTFSAPAAPPPSAPQAPVANAGNARNDIAIASLNPPDKSSAELPVADQAGQFSKAPVVGPPSADGGKSGIKESNLAIGEDRTKPKPPEVSAPMKAVLYAEKVRMGPPSTFSVPLRPGARSLPRAIEARFQGRNVFTIVVPIENFPVYGGDWILWFAEHESGPGSTPAMRAPIPFRKMELLDQAVPLDRTPMRIQIAALLPKTGKLDSISFLTATTPSIEQAVLQDIGSWEFKPATRNGTALDVDVVLEIPFNLPSGVPKR